MHARTASFCTERSGHYDAFDQGLVFFLPNMTWGQPPYYVHAMIKDVFQQNALRVTSPTTPAGDLSQMVSAMVSDDRSSLTLLVANQFPGGMVRRFPDHFLLFSLCVKFCSKGLL